MIELQRSSEIGLADQITLGLEALIERGELLEGARIPSVRQMSKRLSVSPFTVVAAYDKLVSRNILIARHGSGYYVANRNQRIDLADIEGATGDPSEAVGFAIQNLDSGQLSIKAGSGFLPEDWLSEVIPPAMILKVAKADSSLFLSGPAQGSVGLRRQLAERLQARGISAVSGQIVTTIGASQAFDLLLRTLLRPGDSVAVEDPGYFVLFSQLQSYGLRLVSIPRQSDGPDLDALEEVVKLHRPKVFFTQTLLHNPTGSSTSAAKCHRLLLLAERLDFKIVEDDVSGDLAAEGVTRLAALDELRRVFYVGSFSKLLSPALRVGFIAVPRDAVEALVAKKILSMLGSPGFAEKIVEVALSSGRFQRHTKLLRSRLIRFRQRAHALLNSAGIEITRPVSEGMFIWGRLPGIRNPDELVRNALADGILLARGSMFSPSGQYADYMRFNAAHSCEARLAEFLAKWTVRLAATAEVHSLRPVTAQCSGRRA